MASSFYGAQKSSADGVLSWYDEQDQANFVIYRHNTKAETARYEGGDKDVGGQRLNRFLSEIEPSDYAIYILQLLPGSKKGRDRTLRYFSAVQKPAGTVRRPQQLRYE